eukprot:CAMPEP_0171248700 /NCGR_PEP_ID=MMETSP0790-20130122/49156_1 /TAXON_ID=2925 /ORGANISM="Alexandrium catenella, Strain OF101" /LENGTH=38 /DNA_ID= /DNA_START= /DNA_END= /DNA_ORIENTATION=
MLKRPTAPGVKGHAAYFGGTPQAQKGWARYHMASLRGA